MSASQVTQDRAKSSVHSSETTIHKSVIDALSESQRTDTVRMNEFLAARAKLSGGLVTAADARACGYDRQALSRLAGSGGVVRIGLGAYVEAGSHASASPEQRHRLATRAVVQRFAGRAAASHYSALTLLGLPVWQAPLERIHVTRTGTARDALVGP